MRVCVTNHTRQQPGVRLSRHVADIDGVAILGADVGTLLEKVLTDAEGAYSLWATPGGEVMSGAFGDNGP